MVAHAVPGFNASSNAYYTEDFANLVDVTLHLDEVRKCGMTTPPGRPGTAEVAVWNANVWRKVGSAGHDGEHLSFQVAAGQGSS